MTQPDPTDGTTEPAGTDEGAPEAQAPEIPPEVKRALSKANSEAAKLRQKLAEFEDRDKTELQRQTEAVAAAKTEAERAQTELLRYRVAAAKKLPLDLAARLQGATEAELAADADVLVKQLGTAGAPKFDAGARGKAAGPQDMNALIRRAAGHSE